MTTRHARKRDAVASQRRILRAAEQVFADRGYAGARVADIAKRARMSPRMLYHYFHSKERLYAAVAEHNFQEIVTSLLEAQARNREAPAAQRVAAFVATYFDVVHAHPNYLRYMFWESAAGWKVLNRLPAYGLDRLVSMLIADVAEGMESGELRGDLSPQFVWLMAGTIPFYYHAYLPRGEHFLEQDLRSPEAIAHGRESLLDFFLAAISRPGGQRPAAS